MSWRVRRTFFLPNGVFLLCDHGLDFLHQLMSEFNQSINEPVVSSDTSGWFSDFGGTTSEETEESTFEIKEGLVQRLGLWRHITSTVARALVMTVLLYYVWLTCGSSLYNRLALTDIYRQPETVCGITNDKDRFALGVEPAAETWNRGNSRLVSVMVDSMAPSHHFDDAQVPGLRYRVENHQTLAILRWITTTGGNQLKGVSQELLRGHTIDAQGLKRGLLLLVLVVLGLGRKLISVKQDGTLPGGEPLAGTLDDDKPQERSTLLRKASPAGGVPQASVLEHPEQSTSPG